MLAELMIWRVDLLMIYLNHPHQSVVSRRKFINGLAFGAAAYVVPGVYAEALTATVAQVEGPFYPDKLPLDTDNDLIVINDSITPAIGEVTHLTGRVMDLQGKPLRNAKVEIWQKNAAGKYHSLLDPRSEYIDKHFSMSGRSITDNLGNYSFITILPGGSPGRAPHINMNVSHPKFGKLQTEVYFEKHPFNESDFQFMSYPEEDRKALIPKVKHTEILNTRSIKICTFDVVMKGVQQFKGY